MREFTSDKETLELLLLDLANRKYLNQRTSLRNGKHSRGGIISIATDVGNCDVCQKVTRLLDLGALTTVNSVDTTKLQSHINEQYLELRKSK